MKIKTQRRNVLSLMEILRFDEFKNSSIFVVFHCNWVDFSESGGGCRGLNSL